MWNPLLTWSNIWNPEMVWQQCDYKPLSAFRATSLELGCVTRCGWLCYSEYMAANCWLISDLPSPFRPTGRGGVVRQQRTLNFERRRRGWNLKWRWAARDWFNELPSPVCVYWKMVLSVCMRRRVLVWHDNCFIALDSLSKEPGDLGRAYAAQLLPKARREDFFKYIFQRHSR